MSKAPVRRLPDGPPKGHRGRVIHEQGVAFENAVHSALSALPSVVVSRNAVTSVTTQGGRLMLTGIGDAGSPDFLVEVRTPAGVFAAVWMECKSGSAPCRAAQRTWHAEARAAGRHVYVVRSVADAVRIAEAFARGEVPT